MFIIGQISTSTGSFEPLDQHDPNISRLATQLFEKAGDYLLTELNTSCVSCQILNFSCNLCYSCYSLLSKNQVEPKTSYNFYKL